MKYRFFWAWQILGFMAAQCTLQKGGRKLSCVIDNISQGSSPIGKKPQIAAIELSVFFTKTISSASGVDIKMKIRFDSAPIAGTSWFDAPIKMITAHHAEEIIDALNAVDMALKQGFWIAGFASYDLGYALEPRLTRFLSRNQKIPLFQFGVYNGPSAPAEPQIVNATFGPFDPLWTFDEYKSAFDHIKAAICAGDVYQINLTFPMIAPFHGDPWSAYLGLAQTQSVSHGAFVDLGDGRAILSRSPELFFKTSANGRIETKPMKGTQPRFNDLVRDQHAKDFLRSDVKNRAENLMIVDLLRNDISRICAQGSVKVPDLFDVETYATVHQMVSRVVGQLVQPITFGDILHALFPCGSITGAPKISAMELINAVEPASRGAYCGAIGWIAPDGQSEFNVAIRTILIENGLAHLNVGGGVVYDSDARSEYEEALWKARFVKISPMIAA
jgi:para-aminobenzoate synthetase component 1